MALIKISDKHSNLRLKFEHPIVLNPDKKYKLGVSNLLLSFEKNYYINLFVEWYISVPDTQNVVTVKSIIAGDYSISSLKKQFQKMFDEDFNGLLEQNKKDKKFDINQKLKKLRITPVKFDLKKLDDEYVVVLNFPFKLKLIKDMNDNFCKFFRFKKYIQDNSMLAAGTEYTSESITEVVNPFSVIEWHCNIAEHSYANHDGHPHLHKHEELLHISFVNNNFYENSVYMEDAKKIMYIPLKKGLREIREIILTPMDVNGEEIKNLKDAVVYLHLKEKM